MSNSEDPTDAPADPRVQPPPEVDSERLAFEENWQRNGLPTTDATEPQVHETVSVPVIISVWELIVGAICIVLWFVLFAGGILIATQPYLQQLNTNMSVGRRVHSWVMVLCFWTITNIGMLSCLSAMLGALGRRTRFTVLVATHPCVEPQPQDARSALVFYYSAVMRGFGIYTLVQAGLLVLATKAFIQPEQGEYLRLAATMSVLGFYAGYDPEMFGVLLSRVRRLFESPPQ